MPKFYLHAADQAAMDAALFEAGIIEPSPFDGQLWPKMGYDLVRIGELKYLDHFEPAGPGQSGDTPIFKTIPGYHANLTAPALTEEQAARLPLIEPPATPKFD